MPIPIANQSLLMIKPPYSVLLIKVLNGLSLYNSNHLVKNTFPKPSLNHGTSVAHKTPICIRKSQHLSIELLIAIML